MTNSTGDGGRWPFDPIESTAGTGANPEPARQPWSDPARQSWFASTEPARTPEPARAQEPVSAGEPATPTVAGGPAGPGDSASGGGGGRRRPPLWLLILVGVVVVGAVVAAVLMLTKREPEAETLDPETVTLPVETPTVDPIAREEGTAFQNALPSTVLAFALTEIVEHEPWLASGAVESWRLTYTDGTDTIVVYAGQWPDATGSEAMFDQVLAANPAEAEATEPTEPAEDTATEDTATEDTEEDATATTPAPVLEREEGVVEVDGQQVGRFLFLPRPDGTGSIYWTNTTVFIQVDGPADVLRDVFAANAL